MRLKAVLFFSTLREFVRSTHEGRKFECIELGILVEDFGILRKAGRTALETADCDCQLELFKAAGGRKHIQAAEDHFGSTISVDASTQKSKIWWVVTKSVQLDRRADATLSMNTS